MCFDGYHLSFIFQVISFENMSDRFDDRMFKMSKLGHAETTTGGRKTFLYVQGRRSFLELKKMQNIYTASNKRIR